MALIDHNVTFRNLSYIGVGVVPVSLRRSLEDKSGAMSISLPNIDDELARLIQFVDIQGSDVLVQRTTKRQLNSGYREIPYRGRVDGIGIDGTTANISCVAYTSDDERLKRIPRRTLGTRCGVIWGGEDCGIDVRRHTVTGLFEAQDAAASSPISIRIRPDTADAFYANAMRLPAFMFWESGLMTGQSRQVAEITVNGLVHDVRLLKPFPVKPIAGDRWGIRRICNKTEPACVDEFNNWARNHSFPHTPREPRGLSLKLDGKGS